MMKSGVGILEQDLNILTCPFRTIYSTHWIHKQNDFATYRLKGLKDRHVSFVMI